MECPVCAKEVKTEAGLRKHVMGTRSFGGHEHTFEEAELLIHQARNGESVAVVPLPVVTPAPPEAALAFMTEVFDLLVSNKLLPKYQFERRVDIFVNVFLADVLGALFGGTYQLIVPEFPLKNPDNCGSANVDYLLFCTMPDGHQKWIFLELKTAAGSIDTKQLANYRRIAERGMPLAMTDVALICDGTDAHAEYKELSKRLAEFKSLYDRPIEIIYLAPVAMNEAELGIGGHSVTFAQLRTLELERHPEVWRMFRDSVLARAF